MATAAQYECFKDTYDRELKRHERLIDRGKVYLSLITLYLGLLGVAADKVVPRITENWLVAASYVCSIAAFFSALAFLLFALGVYSYVYPTDLKGIIDRLGPQAPSDSEFFDDRIVEFAAAFHANLAVDEKRARCLKHASWCMMAGMLFQGFVLSSLLFLQAA